MNCRRCRDEEEMAYAYQCAGYNIDFYFKKIRNFLSSHKCLIIFDDGGNIVVI